MDGWTDVSVRRWKSGLQGQRRRFPQALALQFSSYIPLSVLAILYPRSNY